MRRVGVVGATGKMGTEAVAAIDAAQDLTLAAVVAPRDGAARDGVVWARDLAELDPGTVDVVVDLTSAEVARRTLDWVVAHGKDAVVGTSGLTDEDLAAAASGAGATGARILIVPNFSIGAALLARFAAAAAPYFTSVEVIELHHDQKCDAPSGTSIATAGAIAASRAAAGMGEPIDPTTSHVLDGARGASGPGGVRVHSVRLPGLLAHQEVLFGSVGEGLVLRHDTYDRSSFMAGLLRCVRGVEHLDGVTVGLDAVLDR